MASWLRCFCAILLSSWWSITSISAQAQCLPAPTCTPGNAPAATALGYGIFRVRIANLDTITNGAGDGYQDYSCSRAIRLNRGTTYSLRVTTNSSTDEQVNAWVDFNQNGAFDPVTERVLSSTGRQHTGSFTVPTTIAAGASLRLRIAADDIYSPVSGPCTTPQYSQTEDYRVVLTAALPPLPQAAFSAKDSVTCGAAVQLRDYSRNAPLAWHWDFGDGTGSIQQHPVHTYAAAGTYAVRLRVCNATGCDSLTKPAFILVRTDGPRAAPCQPATQAFCCQVGIDRVQLAGINHQPGGGAAGYQDASCANRATLRADWTDTLHLTTGGQIQHDVRVYLDLNDDGQFTAATELLYQGLGVKNPAIALRVSSLTPGLVYNKALRLRICADYAGSPAVGPCAAPQWGQVADYSVQLLPNTLKPQAALRLTYTQACGPVKVDFVNTSLGSTAYQWEFGDGTTSTASTPPAHTYATPGAYVVQLIAFNGAQTDTVKRQVVVAVACPTYCTTAGLGGSASTPVYFTRVQLASLDNRDIRTYGTGYRDFTARYTELQQGQIYTLRAESLPWAFAGSGPWMRVTAWIDFDQDGNFATSERLGQVLTFSPHQLPFRVPPGAPIGATRLRVQIAYATQPSDPSSSCTPAYQNVATEDYTVLVTPAALVPQTGFTVNLVTSCNATVQFRDTSYAAPSQWHWTFGDGATSSLQHPQHSYAQAGTYAISLQASNYYGTQTITKPAYVTIAALTQGPKPAACLPPPGPDVNLGGYWSINSLEVGAWTYTNPARLAAYRDETCNTPVIQLATTSPTTITLRKPNASYALTIQFIAWLDANDDGVFDPVAERVYNYQANGYGPAWTIPLTIPVATLRNRPLRLRVWWMGGGSNLYVPEDRPCYRHEELGQVRDFTVVVSTPLAANNSTLINQAPWQLYPNPATGLVSVQAATTFSTTAQVFDIQGRLVWSQAIRLSPTTAVPLNLSSLAAGVYILRLANSSGQQRLVLLPE